MASDLRRRRAEDIFVRLDVLVSLVCPAKVAHDLTTDQKVWGSNPYRRTNPKEALTCSDAGQEPSCL
jgi:hypothetical protein